MSAKSVAALLSALFLISACACASAGEIWHSDGGVGSASLNLALKWTSVLSHSPDDRVFYPERWSAESLWRGRVMAKIRGADWLSAELAYENRLRLLSEGSGAAGTAFLPSSGFVPYRLVQLDEELVSVGETLTYAHELDRAFVRLTPGPFEIRAGRQAVGLGRGVLFGAMDLFAPFSPLESDREWRRGVDALRLSAPLTESVSVEGLLVLGETVDESSCLLRLSGTVGGLDGEIVAGTRCEDTVIAMAASHPVLDAEVHAEAAVFLLPEPLPGGTAFGEDELAMTAVLGASYVFDVGEGLMAAAEYHYSGFGASDVSDGMDWLLDPVVLGRLARGDMLILGRHAAALQLTYGLAGTAPLGLVWIASPVDGSGVVGPSLNWIFSDNVTLTGAFYIPHGADSRRGRLRSEYGATPTSALLQLSFYY